MEGRGGNPNVDSVLNASDAALRSSRQLAGWTRKRPSDIVSVISAHFLVNGVQFLQLNEPSKCSPNQSITWRQRNITSSSRLAEVQSEHRSEEQNGLAGSLNEDFTYQRPTGIFYNVTTISSLGDRGIIKNMPAVVPRKIAVLMSEVRGQNGWRSQTGINLWLQPRATSANAQRLQPWRSPHCISFVISIYVSSFLMLVVPDKVASDDFKRLYCHTISEIIQIF